MIDLIHLEDWIAIYKDGELVFQDHRAEPEDILRILYIDYFSRWIEDWDYDREIPNKLELLSQ